jgi:hypothetical protein
MRSSRERVPQDVDGRLHASPYFIKTQIAPYLD